MSPNTQYKATIVIDFGNLRPITGWCERNCVGDWGWSEIEPAGKDAGIYEFYFEEERDKVAFVLWKT